MAAIGTASFAGVGLDDGIGVLDGCIFGAVLRLDIFKSQLDLLIADALRAATELGAAKNRDNMIKAFGTRGETVNLGRENLALVRQALALGIQAGILSP